MRAWATVIAWLLGPPAATALVIVLGDLGELGWPPPPGRWDVWLQAGDPAVMVVALLRLALVVACGLTSLRVCVAIAEAVLTPPSMTVATVTSAPESLRRALLRITRPALAVGLGVSLVSSSAAAVGASTAPAATNGQGSMPVRTEPADAAHEPNGPGADDSPAGGSYAELRRVRIEIAPRPAADELAASAPEVWVVARGDHLWGIASATLTDHLGEAPSERRVRRYWQRLIEINEERFVIPGEPDVIWPGQRLVLPRLGPGTDQRSGT